MSSKLLSLIRLSALRSLKRRYSRRGILCLTLLCLTVPPLRKPKQQSTQASKYPMPQRHCAGTASCTAVSAAMILGSTA